MCARAFTRVGLEALHSHALYLHGDEGAPSLGTYLDACAQLWSPNGDEVPPLEVVEYLAARDACALCCELVRDARCACCSCECECNAPGGYCQCNPAPCGACQRWRIRE
jgi:hypothetical protein